MTADLQRCPHGPACMCRQCSLRPSEATTAIGYRPRQTGGGDGVPPWIGADLQRCRDEQVQFATLLLASGSLQNPPTSYQFGLRMAATDAMLEECFILTEQPATLHTETERRGLIIPASDVLGGVSPTVTAQASDTCGEVNNENPSNL